MSLTRTMLQEQMRELLLERTLKGELQPRDRLVELQIDQEHGTSQEPAREALKEDLQRKPAARSGSTLRQHFETLRTMMKRGENA